MHWNDILDGIETARFKGKAIVMKTALLRGVGLVASIIVQIALGALLLWVITEVGGRGIKAGEDMFRNNHCTFITIPRDVPGRSRIEYPQNGFACYVALAMPCLYPIIVGIGGLLAIFIALTVIVSPFYLIGRGLQIAYKFLRKKR